MQRRQVILMMVAACAVPARAGDEAAPYTPKPGSAERKAICDAMRVYARKQCPGHHGLAFLWTIGWLKVSGRHAAFEGCAVQADGKPLDDGTALGDIQFTTFLRKGEHGWAVIADLTRGDVPSAEELKELRGRFPLEIPTAIIPDYWRDKLR
jgi:hypothetical protein